MFETKVMNINGLASSPDRRSLQQAAAAPDIRCEACRSLVGRTVVAGALALETGGPAIRAMPAEAAPARILILRVN
jgi:hypothetical protein